MKLKRLLTVIGFSFISAASTQTTASTQVLGGTMLSDPSAPAPNAYLYFSEAAGALQDREKVGTELTPADKAEFVRQNSRSLELLHQGLPYNYESPLQCDDELYFPTTKNNRTLARLLVMEGEVHLDKNETAKAADSFVDAIHLGIEIPHNGVLLDVMVGMACETIGRRHVWDILGKLNAAEARHLARRLEVVESRRYSFGQALSRENSDYLFRPLHNRDGKDKALTQKQKDEANLLHEELMYAGMPYPDWASRPLPPPSGYQDPVPFYSFRKGDTPKPSAKPKPKTSEKPHQSISSEKTVPKPNATYVTQMELRELYNYSRFQVARYQANNVLLTMALVLHAYKLEQGHYPASLDVLFPDYLERMPLDPFTRNKALMYRSDGTTYTLYSLGADCVDDGGKKPTDPYGALVSPDTKGDIVVTPSSSPEDMKQR